jgi:ribose 5-phosphate isomerase A
MTAADHALTLIQDGWTLGLGSGRAAQAFVRALAARVAAGLRVSCVASSQATEKLASDLGLTLTTLDKVEWLDMTVDGADEVDPQLNLIKGRGGALVREKIVAASSRRLVILVGAEKFVGTLGEHGLLPVEIVPFGLPLCRRRLLALGYPATLRQEGDEVFVTDNGNYILDCQIVPSAEPAELERALQAIPGVVGTGLFLGMAELVLIQDGTQVRVRSAPPNKGP